MINLEVARALADAAHREDSLAGLEAHYDKLRETLPQAIAWIDELTKENVETIQSYERATKVWHEKLEAADEAWHSAERRVIEMEKKYATAVAFGIVIESERDRLAAELERMTREFNL